MAIREEEVEQLVEGRPDAIVVPTGNGMAIDLGDHAGAVARVRRHVLRRLLIADVVAWPPPPSSAAAGERAVEQPGDAADQLGPIMILNLAMIPCSSGVRRVQPLQGLDPPDLVSVFSDLRNIVHACW